MFQRYKFYQFINVMFAMPHNCIYWTPQCGALFSAIAESFEYSQIHVSHSDSFYLGSCFNKPLVARPFNLQYTNIREIKMSRINKELKHRQ